MSNHSSQMDPEIQRMYAEVFNQMKKGQDFVRLPNIGPTGQFPEGKLTEQDEGEIKIAIANHQGKVIIDFGSQVTWIGFTPELAEQLAQSLIEKAKKAREENG